MRDQHIPETGTVLYVTSHEPAASSTIRQSTKDYASGWRWTHGEDGWVSDGSKKTLTWQELFSLPHVSFILEHWGARPQPGDELSVDSLEPPVWSFVFFSSLAQDGEGYTFGHYQDGWGVAGVAGSFAQRWTWKELFTAFSDLSAIAVLRY